MKMSRSTIAKLNKAFSSRTKPATAQHQNRPNFNNLYKSVLQKKRPAISPPFEVELRIDNESYYLQLEDNDDYIILE